MEKAREVLEKLKNGEISIEEAEQYFRSEPFKEMGFAKLDTHREKWFSGSDFLPRKDG